MNEVCQLHTQIQQTLNDHSETIGGLGAQVKNLCDKHDKLMDKLEKFVDDYQESKMLLQETNRLVKRMNGNSAKPVILQPDPDGTGIVWFLNKSWKSFVDRWSWVVILFILWAILKWFFFGEIPIPFK